MSRTSIDAVDLVHSVKYLLILIHLLNVFLNDGRHWCGWYGEVVLFNARSAVDTNDDQLMNLPSFLEAFSNIVSQLSQV